MKKLITRTALVFSIATIGLTGIMSDAEAARLGGRKSTGMQRSGQEYNMPNRSQTPSTNAPQRNPQTNTTPNTSPQPQSRMSRWMGPIAGIAAGLGIAALFSHLGLGAGLANLVTMLLLGWIAMIAIRWLLNAFRAKKPQTAGTYGYSHNQPDTSRTSGYNGRASNPVILDNAPVTSTQGQPTPANVNPDEFLRIAKGMFIRLQAANDKKDTDDLRRFLTPEMFAEAQLQISERGNTEQTTDILDLNATVISLVTEGTHDIGSVRFTGKIKCSDQVMAEDISEVWHFTKWHNHTDQWSLAGIQQD